MTYRSGLVAAVVGMCGLAGSVHGQTPGGADDDAMRGPKVKEVARPASLVQRDMAGALVRLETRPEHGALDFLGLRGEERKGADEVLAKRQVKVNEVLREHYELFIKLQTARQGGAKQEEVRPLMREMRPALAGLLEPGLERQVSEALPEGKRAEFGRLVDEYKRVMAAEEPRGMGQGAGTGGGGGEGRRARREQQPADGAGAKGDGMQQEPAKGEPASGPIPARVEMNLALREMARALKGIVDERKEHMDALLKAIDATPEQEAKIREITRAAAAEKGGRDKSKDAGNPGLGTPAEAERIATWRKILEVLTPEQRRKAMESRRAGA